jgi:hypothetical protein
MANDDYYRGDQKEGITAPDLAKSCEYSEHIVRARGKRTQYTSVSLDQYAISRFGDSLYHLIRQQLVQDHHRLVEHDELSRHLISEARHRDKGERLIAIQALRYAKRRREGLVVWNFDIGGVERKNLITWAYQKVQQYFRKC